jgi:hypothetical protein
MKLVGCPWSLARVHLIRGAERHFNLVSVAVHVTEHQLVAAIGKMRPSVKRAADGLFKLGRRAGARHDQCHDGDEGASPDVSVPHTHPPAPRIRVERAQYVRYSNDCSLSTLFSNMPSTIGQRRRFNAMCRFRAS